MMLNVPVAVDINLIETPLDELPGIRSSESRHQSPDAVGLLCSVEVELLLTVSGLDESHVSSYLVASSPDSDIRLDE